MSVFLSIARRIGNLNPSRAALALVATLGLAACEPGGFAVGGPRVDATRPVQVALLVPGGSADAGRQVLATSLENAARMAVADLAGVQIDLRIYETGGEAARAAVAARQAADDGAAIILGPLFAESARAAGDAVAARGLNVLSFSNNTAVAGRNVFVLGLTFENTAHRLLDYAARQGQGDVMVISEQTDEGRIASAAIRAAATRSGARVVAEHAYAFSQQGIVDALTPIGEQARASGAQTLFFTANTAGALPVLSQLLPDNRLGPPTFQYMGLTRWDVPEATLALRGLQGGWFAMPDPALSDTFSQRYRAAFGQAPHPLAGLAYDGIAAIGALLAAGGPDPLSRAALTQGSGFVGVNGVFRLMPDGTNQRGLAVATIRNNAVAILEPAPRSFAGPGF